MNKAFYPKTPSVFSVCSPFQALCAIAVIRQYEIEDYRMVVRLLNGGFRNAQVEETLRQYGIKYRSIRYINRITYGFIMLKALLRRRNHYTRLFIGDYRDILNIYVGCGMVSDRSDIVYIDDGNPTISQLRGRDTEPLENRVLCFLDRLSARRGFIFNKNVLTIYDDISNPAFNIQGLHLNLVVPEKNREESSPRGVFIVGTNVERYCIPMGIPVDYFISFLDSLMRDLRKQYPADEVVYIAHSLEKMQYAQVLCERYSCTFRQPKTMVELDLLSLENRPKTIVGFGSNALFTLKKLFPSSRVINYLFKGADDNPFYIDNLDFSRYYQQNGIELVEVPLK